MSPTFKNRAMIIGLIILVSIIAYDLITGDVSRFNNTYLGK